MNLKGSKVFVKKEEKKTFGAFSVDAIFAETIGLK
jgi:hypothetical protein